MCENCQERQDSKTGAHPAPIGQGASRQLIDFSLRVIVAAPSQLLDVTAPQLVTGPLPRGPPLGD